MKKLILAILIVMFSSAAVAGPPQRSKFYDFSDQLIDGERKQPTALYTDAREQVKFDRLLTIKKSFLKKLLNTSKERVFK